MKHVLVNKVGATYLKTEYAFLKLSEIVKQLRYNGLLLALLTKFMHAIAVLTL